MQHMSDAADEIGTIAKEMFQRKAAMRPSAPPPMPAYVKVSGLPETPYERLVGRDDELKRLDEAWTNLAVNVLSLVAEGGAGKSALVNQWLTRRAIGPIGIGADA